MKRVLTGHDAGGRSRVCSEDEPQGVLLDKAGGPMPWATSHAWSNRTDRPAREAFVLIDAERHLS